MFTIEQFRPIKTILGATTVDATADTITLAPGTQITFINVTGNIWINPNGTAVADATSLKTTAGDQVSFAAVGNLSIISDVTGGTYQYIIWKSV